MKKYQDDQNIAIRLIFFIFGALIAILLYSIAGNFILALCFFILGATFSIAFK